MILEVIDRDVEAVLSSLMDPCQMIQEVIDRDMEAVLSSLMDLAE